MKAWPLGAMTLARVPRLGGADRLQRDAAAAAGLAGAAAWGAASRRVRPSPQARARATASSRARVSASDLFLVPIVLLSSSHLAKESRGRERARTVAASDHRGESPLIDVKRWIPE